MRRAFEGLSEERRLFVAGASVAVAGAIWAALCLILDAGGHAPTATVVPIPREHYYRAQAAFVVPVLLAQWTASAAIAATLARRPFRAMASALGPALAAPLVATFLLPDLIVYLIAGFDALGALVRVTAPLLLFATVAVATVSIGKAADASNMRALRVAALAVVIPAVLASALLR